MVKDIAFNHQKVKQHAELRQIMTDLHMNLLETTALFFIILMLSCQSSSHISHPNQFSETSDTLKITTKKVKGSGLFLLGAGRLTFQDTTEEYSYSMIYPPDISEVKRAQKVTDFAKPDADLIDIMSGLLDEQEVFIVDQNGNKDFRDDEVRPMRDIEWNSSEYSIQCQFRKMIDGDTIADSSWVMIGLGHGGKLYGRDEHLVADFRLGEKQYEIGIVDMTLSSTFTYGLNPQIAVLSNDEQSKDTLFSRDLIHMGDCVYLEGNYYRFDTIAHFGEWFTLVKEDNFEEMVGTQVGMLAPSFEAIAVSGDTIRSRDLLNKPIVVANSCGCGGDKQSTEAYYQIDSAYGSRIHALRLDSGIKDDTVGLQFDMENPFNKDLSDKYRQAYCSRLCYLVGRNRRILDKFRIVDWGSNLNSKFID